MASVISVSDGDIRVEVGEIIESVKSVMTDFGEELLVNVPFAIAVGVAGILFIVLCAVTWSQKRAAKKQLKRIVQLDRLAVEDQSTKKELKEVIRKLLEEKQELQQDKQRLEQEIADKIGRRELSNLKALRKFYGVDFFKELEVSPMGELKQSSGVDEGSTPVPVFNKEVLTNLKEMAEVIGAVINIGPDDNGKALAKNVAAEMKIPMQELHDFVTVQIGNESDSMTKSLKTLTDKLVKKIEGANNTPEVNIDKLVETAIEKYQTDINKRLCEIKDARSGINTWTIAELKTEINKQLEPLKQKVMVVDKKTDRDFLAKLLAGNQDTLMKQLEKSVEGLELIPKMVSTHPVVEIGKSTDPIDLLERAELLLRSLDFFIYISKVDMKEDDVDETDLQYVSDFKKSQRNK